MRHSLQGKLLPLTTAVALGLVALIAVWAAVVGREPKQFDVKDRSFHFTFCAVTAGTTHTVIRGNALLGWVNRQLIGHSIHRISRDQVYTLTTTRSETLLTIGYRHANDVLKLDPTATPTQLLWSRSMR